jgi:hypothetical protein
MTDPRKDWGMCWVCNTDIPPGEVYCARHEPTPPPPVIPPPPPPPPIKMIAIDPGKKNLAWAAFFGAELVSCGLARARTGERFDLELNAAALAEGIPKGFDHAVVERMVHYASIHRKDTIQLQDSIANDLLDLQEIGAIVACASGATRLFYYTPHQWKGPRPKNVVHKQVRGVLSADETKTLETCLKPIPSALRHNPLDAVGLGLRHVRRIVR